jgi:hypothetical protein
MAALSTVAIVSTERQEKTDRNDWDTARGNLKTYISSLYHKKKVLVIVHYQNNILVFCTSVI